MTNSPTDALNLDSFLERPADIAKDASLTDEQFSKKITTLFIRSCSNGDIVQVKDILSLVSDSNRISTSDLLQAVDQDGSNGLIYASCWGHIEIVEILLDAGVPLDQKDGEGWTALLWACSNGHDHIARLLVQAGASRDTRSNKGRSMQQILRRSSTTKEIASILHDGDFGYLEDLDKVDSYSEGDVESSPSKRYSQMSFSSEDIRSFSEMMLENRNEDELEEYADNGPFEWSTCQLDQMLVFDINNLDHIIDVAVTKSRPTKSAIAKPLAANLLFLCARYAHYYNPMVTDEVFARSLKAIVAEVRSNREDTHIICYWISSSTQLLYYLKRDIGLCQATFHHQASLGELIDELYERLLQSVERQIYQLLDTALLEYVEDGKRSKPIRFDNALTSFGRKQSLLKQNRVSKVSPGPPSSSHLTPKSPTRSHLPPPRRLLPRLRKPHTITPWSICSILSNTLMCLITSSVHNSIISQFFHQLFYSVASETFNRLLTSKTLLCRSRALQVRMNVSLLEDWARENSSYVNPAPETNNPSDDSVPQSDRNSLPNLLKPVVHLTQFLQVISSLNDLAAFLETKKGLESINMVQVRMAMENYKFEMGEPSFPDEIEAYVITIAEELKNAAEDAVAGEVEISEPPLTVLYDPQLRRPFQIPVFSGTDEDVGWGWSGLTPSIPSSILSQLDVK